MIFSYLVLFISGFIFSFVFSQNTLTQTQIKRCVSCIKEKCDNNEIQLRYSSGLMKTVVGQLCQDADGQLVNRICSEWPRHTGGAYSTGYDDLSQTVKGRSAKNVLEMYQTEDAQAAVTWSEHFHNKYARQCFSEN